MPYSAPTTVDLSQHVAIVTGAASALGAAAAKALAGAGAGVVLNDVNPARLEAIANEITAAGGRAAARDGDVANRFQASALIEAARDLYGRVTILINGESVFKRGDMHFVDEWDWRRAMDVNLTGAFFCTQLIGRVMAEEGGGCIVNIASTAGFQDILHDGIGFATSMAGLVGLTRQSAYELGLRGVRVNAVCPPAYEPDAEEVASAILFLVSDLARGISGQAVRLGNPAARVLGLSMME